jgi:hypothetical protein
VILVRNEKHQTNAKRRDKVNELFILESQIFCQCPNNDFLRHEQNRESLCSYFLAFGGDFFEGLSCSKIS